MQPSPYSGDVPDDPAQPPAQSHRLISPLSIAESKTNPRKHFDGGRAR